MKKNITITVLLSCMATPLFAEKPTPDKPAYTVTMTSTPPVIDGRASQGEWSEGTIATGFTQLEPNSGSPASQKTEVKIFYDETHLYVLAQMFDTEPNKIAGQLFRRDGSGYSDWFEIFIDSYGDKRTAFAFGINPRGVKRDILFFNDNDEDSGWDAVWDGAAKINSQGWTAEMRIPLSQLRYDGTKKEQVWGLQFWRFTARNAEQAFWAPRLRESTGFVSQFGTMQGVQTTAKSRRLEVLPYTSSALRRVPGNNANPFYKTNDLAANYGADFKYGLGSNFTLTGTINPDFGQVEADPAVINLSVFETFFRERRPFFLEGTDLFQFGRTRTFNSNAPRIFYSRRIGRSPQGAVNDTNATFIDKPNQTSIAAAIKLSGKTAGGWSIGLLDAITTREQARFSTPGRNDNTEIVEPLSNYTVLRAKKDFNNGNTTAGGFFDAAIRDLSTDNLKRALRKNAYIAGFDFEHKPEKSAWVVSGVFSGSYLSGESGVVTNAQTASQRYFSRPDADYMQVDPTATSLTGHNLELSLQKHSGKHWIGSLTYGEVSPGFEVNDLGFQNRADYRSLSSFVMYREKTPTRLFRNYQFYWWSNPGWNYGGDMIFASNGVGSEFRFNNFWSIELDGRFTPESSNDRLTRGGPIARRPSDWNVSFELESDSRKNLSFGIEWEYREDASGEFDKSLELQANYRPNPSVELELEAAFSKENDTDQFVTGITDAAAVATFGKRYVFADLKSENKEFSMRLDWTFTPNLSLQFVATPYISSYDFNHLKEFRRPGTFEFDQYGKDVGTLSVDGTGDVTIDPDGAGPSESFDISNQDFNARSIRINSVLRWEYKPGSTLFLVWQQERDDFEERLGKLDFGSDFGALFRVRSANTFLIKASYWFGY